MSGLRATLLPSLAGRRAHRAFKPDLVLYVDRLDAGGSARWGGELPALRGLSGALGPHVWLNTIVALSHAGARALGSGKHMRL